MAWGFVAGAAISVVGGAIASDKASKTADKNRTAAEAAADADRQTAADTLAYYRERDAEANAMAAEANAIAGRVADSQISLMDQQRAIADKYQARNESIFWPLQDQIVDNAKNYDTTEKRDAAAGSAMADVGMQYGLAQASSNRNLQRMGVNPNSSKYGLAQNQMSLGLASAQSAAGKSARDNIETQGWARQLDAANLGNGNASAQATAASTASSAGNSATNSAYSPLNAFNTSTSMMGSALNNYGTSMSNASRLSLSSLPSADNSTSSQLFGLAGSMLGSANYGSSNQNSNLAYANGVSSAGGDGLGAFITKSGW